MDAGEHGGIATPEEIEEAIHDLTEGQLQKLGEYAGWRIRGIGRAALGRDRHDLLSDAVIATLEGRRRWKKGEVDILRHLRGAIRSISSNWKEKFREVEPRPASELVQRGTETDAFDPISVAPGEGVNPEREAAAKERLDQLTELFEDDEVATLIIDGLRDGMTGPEIQDALGITEREYNAGKKRLLRNARAFRASQEK